MKTRKINVLALCILFTFTYSCKPTKITGEIEKNYTLNDKSNPLIEVEAVSNEMEAIGRNIIKGKTHTPNISGFLECAKISWTNDLEGLIVELIFDKAKVCIDGKIRSGKITIAYNKSNYDTIVIPDGYVVNGAIVDGNFSIDYYGSSPNAANFIVTNGSIKREKERIEFSLSKTSTINDSETLLAYKNASYFINSWSGNSNSFIKAVGLAPLIQKTTCNTFKPVFGRIKIDYTSSGTNPVPLTGSFYLNFGNGSCESKPYLEKNNL